MKRTKKAIRMLIVKAVIIAAIIVAFMQLFTARLCYSNDMYPNIKDGDFVLFSKIASVRYDDVVLYTVDGQEKYGRVAGVEGDHITLTESGGLLVNGSVLYDYLPYRTEVQGEELDLTISEGHVFILSDLREQSLDSRTYGEISRDDIIGKEVFLMRRRGF